MSTPTNHGDLPPNTDVMQHRLSKEDIIHTMQIDHTFTKKMGGPLPEQLDPTSFSHILDIGCDTGGWLIDVAKMYPTIPLLVGIDIRGKSVDIAQKQAEAQQVSNRVQFRQMDALGKLDFPSLYFDLINQRGGGSYLRLWDWPRQLDEFNRMIRPGGVVRLTDMLPIESTSPALTRLQNLFFLAHYKAGHFVAPDHTGMENTIVHLLQQYGFQDIQTRIIVMEFQGDTVEGQQFYEFLRMVYQMLIPFFNKWIRLPADYQETYQQMLKDVQQPDFMATWKWFTIWSHKH